MANFIFECISFSSAKNSMKRCKRGWCMKIQRRSCLMRFRIILAIAFVMQTSLQPLHSQDGIPILLLISGKYYKFSRFLFKWKLQLCKESKKAISLGGREVSSLVTLEPLMVEMISLLFGGAVRNRMLRLTRSIRGGTSSLTTVCFFHFINCPLSWMKGRP